MGILDIFQTKSPLQTAPVQQTAVTNQTVPGDKNIADVSKSDPLAIQAGKVDGGESPLSNYAELWKIEDKDKPVNAQEALTPNFTLDPKKVAEAARTVDYAKLVPAEIMTKAMSGDAAAMSQMLNAVTQAATANAGMNTAQIVQAALAHQAKKFVEILPQQVRNQQVSQQVSQDHPIFQNPAAAPMVSMLKDQFAVKYPLATPAEISKHTSDYLTEFVKSLGGSMPDPAMQAAQATKEAGTMDWEKFLAGPQS